MEVFILVCTMPSEPIMSSLLSKCDHISKVRKARQTYMSLLTGFTSLLYMELAGNHFLRINRSRFAKPIFCERQTRTNDRVCSQQNEQQKSFLVYRIIYKWKYYFFEIKVCRDDTS